MVREVCSNYGGLHACPLARGQERNGAANESVVPGDRGWNGEVGRVGCRLSLLQPRRQANERDYGKVRRPQASSLLFIPGAEGVGATRPTAAKLPPSTSESIATAPSQVAA